VEYVQYAIVIACALVAYRLSLLVDRVLHRTMGNTIRGLFVFVATEGLLVAWLVVAVMVFGGEP